MERYPGISVSAWRNLFCDGDRNGSAVLDGSAVWLFVTGILWERMIGKQALIPILKGDV